MQPTFQGRQIAVETARKILLHVAHVALNDVLTVENPFDDRRRPQSECHRR